MTVAVPHINHESALTVSLVSHGHGHMVGMVLKDLARIPEVVHVVLILNIPEPMFDVPDNMLYKLTIIENLYPIGFSSNHNAAFKYCETDFFCVLNPDIRLPKNPFPVLFDVLSNGAALAAPLVLNSAEEVEDSVRFFPTPFQMLKKALAMSRGRYSIKPGDAVMPVEWVAGMFMLFRAEAYRALDGFDESYFLYYEDVDICVRSWRQGMPVVVCPSVTVTHDAQRASHRNFRFLCWHAVSMLRFFCKHYGRLPDVSEAP